jgi:hypothetical protein
MGFANPTTPIVASMSRQIQAECVSCCPRAAKEELEQRRFMRCAVLAGALPQELSSAGARNQITG